MPIFRPVSSYKELATHVLVGMGAASFWRGAWYILDDHLFPDDAALSAASSWTLGVVGLMSSQGLVAKAETMAQRLAGGKRATLAHRRLALSAARFGSLYTVALSCVLVWRGTWVGWDVVYERFHPHQIHEDPQNEKKKKEAANSLKESPSSFELINTRRLTGTTHLEEDVVNGPSVITSSSVIRSTDPGHATHSGLLSHVVALSLLMGTGLFASVLAPPASVSVIRDIAVKTGQSMVTAVPSRWFQGSSAAAQTTAMRAASSMGTTTTSVWNNAASKSLRGLPTRGFTSCFSSAVAHSSSPFMMTLPLHQRQPVLGGMNKFYLLYPKKGTF